MLFNLGQADINGIPISQVERIEILPATAGGIYGGGAVGGVVNVIRKRDYRGLDLFLGYDGTFRGGSEELKFGASGGVSPWGGGTQITFAATYSKTQPLLVQDNDLWERGRALYIENDPAQSGFVGATPNIRSTNGSPLVLKPAFGGATLGSNHTYVPAGFQGIASDGVASLIANAGSYNTNLSNDGFGRQQTRRSGSEVYSVNANVRQSITSALDAFLDLSYYNNLGERDIPRVNNLVTVSAASPNNPFAQNINVWMPTKGWDFPDKTRSSTFSANGGAILRLNKRWTASVEYSRSQSRAKSEAISQPLLNSHRTAIRLGTLDVLRDVDQFPLDFSPYVINAKTIAGPFKVLQQIATARVSGPVLELPGGSLNLNAVAEYRHDGAAKNRTQFPSSTALTTVTSTRTFPKRSQGVSSIYVEFTAPIVSTRNSLSILRELEVQASIRHDRYQTKVANVESYDVADPPALEYGTSNLRSTDYTLAAKASPIDGLSLRGSFATGFLPPSVHQLSSSSFIDEFGGILGLSDPERGGEAVGSVVPYELLTGGNPDLRPETSKSLAAGVIVEPPMVPGLRLSVDYTITKKRDEFFGISRFQDLIDYPGTFPHRIVRDTSSTAPGPITLINATLINISRAQVKAGHLEEPSDFGLMAT